MAVLGLGAFYAFSGKSLLPPAPACKVTRVTDGDTLYLRCNDFEGPVRLLDFDTPETHYARCPAEKALGDIATGFLRDRLSAAQTLHPTFEGQDKYGRQLVRLNLDGEALADIMIEAGLAVPYKGGKRINWCRKLEN
nr:thermonuclease family protein [Rhodovulum imhoffii]